MSNQVPLPQGTKLYQVTNNTIATPRISLNSLNGNCTWPLYSDSQYQQYLFQSYSQSFNTMYISINDKSVSAFRTGLYNSLNGFDNGFNYRFLNYSSPTITFLPLISATDNGAYVPIVSQGSNIFTLQNWQTYLNNSNLQINNSILLTSQGSSYLSQNSFYRITALSGSTITLYNDPSITQMFNQNQNYIFTRALVNNGQNIYYYGLNNISQYQWVSQTSDTYLGFIDYGITLSTDLSNFILPISLFTNLSISPNINQKIAINISSNGYTSGVYVISNISNNQIYIQPIYPPYIFIHQFAKINLDLNILASNIWYVNPQNVLGTNWLYGTVAWSFSNMNPNLISGSVSSWGMQTGGAKDTIVGTLIYNNTLDNQYINNSDIFSFSIQIPQWTTSNSVVSGLSLNLKYSDTLLQYSGVNS
jgi:hypothetical protein